MLFNFAEMEKLIAIELYSSIKICFSEVFFFPLFLSNELSLVVRFLKKHKNLSCDY